MHIIPDTTTAQQQEEPEVHIQWAEEPDNASNEVKKWKCKRAIIGDSMIRQVIIRRSNLVEGIFKRLGST